MIEFIIIAALVGGIVYAAMRWPDVEARLFPHAARRHDAVRPSEPKETQVPEPKPAAETTIAKGFLKKKEITAEPEVEPEDFHKTQGTEASPSSASKDSSEAPAPQDAADEVQRPSVAEPSDDDSNPDEDEQPQPNPAADYAASPTPPPAPEPEPAPTPAPKPTPKPSSGPGGHVTGAPARPSQPAYVNASAGVEERVEDLAAEADAAYRDRDYEKAEQACLKILMREPKNHKYMTRIGQIYQEMGQLEDAKEAFETAKKLDPKNFFVLNRLAEVERLLNDRGGRTSENKRKPVKDED